MDISNTNGLSNSFRLGEDCGPWIVYEANDEASVLFPIHGACFSITQKVLQWNEIHGRTRPSTMEHFYNALYRQYERNIEARATMRPDLAVTFGSQGLEWEHEFYGARQFWGQDWECEEGWEVGLPSDDRRGHDY